MDLTTTAEPLTMSSLEIAELTGKQHKNVMADIRKMLAELHGEAGVLNFQHTHTNPQNGQSYPIFRLPKRETHILVSGYNIKMRAAIIDRWQELEARVALPTSEERLMRIFAEAIGPHLGALGGKVDQVDKKVDLLTDRVGEVEGRIKNIETQRSGRRPIPDRVKKLHAYILSRMSGACPCCRQPVEEIEFDHFFTNQQADLEHSWPLCKPCHSDLTRGRLTRNQVRSAFDAYQDLAARILPTQPTLLT